MAKKGWSFGALTDALKTAAFVDTGSAANQIPVISAANVLTVSAGAAASGFKVAGSTTSVELVTQTTPAANSIAAMIRAISGANTILFGATTGVDGYATSFNGSVSLKYDNSTKAHTTLGGLNAGGTLSIGVNPPATVNGAFTPSVSIQANAVNEAAVVMPNGRSWTFKANGEMNWTGGIDNSGDNVGIRMRPPVGSFADWTSRGAALQVDIAGADQAAAAVRFTQVGVRNVGVLMAAVSGGNNQIRIQTGQVAAGTAYIQTDAGGSGKIHNFVGGALWGDNDIVATNRCIAGGGGGILNTDGQISGNAWGGTLRSWLMAYTMGTAGLGGQQYYQNDNLVAWESPQGCCLTGYNNGTKEFRMGFFFRQMQGKRPDGTTFNLGNFA